MEAPAQPQVFAFIFPMAAGHINPSLPVARALVAFGHEVHYLCREQMRGAIEDTGAMFHSDVEVESELYDGRELDLFGASSSIGKELGIESEGFLERVFKIKAVQLEMQLPGVLRWFCTLGATAVAYCPMLNIEAAYAAKVLGIPSVALLTTAGPGSMPLAIEELLAMFNVTKEAMLLILESYEPNIEAVKRINASYDFNLLVANVFRPFGEMAVLQHSFTTLVTTCEELQDPMTPELTEIYKRDGVVFCFVGPLFDVEGAQRAAGHKFNGTSDEVETLSTTTCRVRLAKSVGRPVVLVSMGTVLCGDSPEIGWEGKHGSKNGLTGRELCRAAWKGVFEAFGNECAEDGPLLVVSVGPQQDPLGEVSPPANSLCVPVIPQVDILKAGVDVFLTHGGQNSFMEALANAVPLVVCPGFGDQQVNARKAEALGVGLQVARPVPHDGHEAAAAEQYSTDVAVALRRVISEQSFRAAADRWAERLRQAGGVPRAVDVMLRAAAAGQKDLCNKSQACTVPSLAKVHHAGA